MSLFNTLNTGVSGLGANSLGLSVTGDNIANLNTVGFKGSTAEFKDLLMQNLGGGKGQLGMGAFNGRVRQGFGQGSIETTTNAADIALDGKGFFQVVDGEGSRYYTRAGQFSMNTSGNLVSLTGMKLQGYTASADGTLSTTVGDITIPTTTLAGTATTQVDITASLTADTNVVQPLGTFPLAPTTFDDISDDPYTVTTSSTVYDSLGNSHDVTLTYTRTGANTWGFQAWVDGGEAGGTAGQPLEISQGVLEFTSTGALDTTASTAPTATAVTFTGAAAQSISFDMGLTTGGDGGAVTMRGAQSINVTDIVPDGNGSGSLASFDIGADGVVTGVYSNGESRTLGQVVVANFRGESYLARAGNNLWQATRESGEATVGEPGSGGRGQTISYALEMSNVDLEKQFVKLIQSQKGYQASTRVVSTADDMLQELIQQV